MGAYLSEPLTNKTSNDESKDNISCGSSSMQGWRISQEDAHNSILEFDTNTSLFAVYDGHGGAEVAKYCALKLPQFIKDTQAYKDGNFTQALEEAFLGFDASISTPEIIELLKGLSENGEMEADADETIDEEEEVNNLFEEASMPLDKIMAKYQEGKVNPLLSKLGKQGADMPVSPFLRSRRPGSSGDSGAGCSSKFTLEETDSDVSSSVKDSDTEKSNEAQVSTSNGDEKSNGEETDIEKPSNAGDKPTPAESIPDSSEDVLEPPSDSSNTKESVVTSPVKEDQCNGDVTNSKTDLKDGVTSSSQENGDVNNSPNKKGKTLVKATAVSSTEAAAEKSESTRPTKRAAATLYNSLLEIINCSEDDESDSNDETFEGKEEASSSDDEDGAVNGVGGDSSEEADVDDEDSSDDDEDDEADEMDAFNMMIKNEPGSNSGCTAVVALLRGNELYVANAGDSRCVVCRDGKAIDMSIDHKPEDEIELNRINKAGGKVSSDGRVNGGLNLSRAIGDLGYKQNKELGPKEQMITALPDVKKLTINPATDEFIVLACDGIWNSMSSQEVVEFVRCRLEKGVEKLSQICEEMFDHCLSPNTAGDGTGCDNMTAVIVKLKEISNLSKKRPSDDEAMEEIQAKRTKTEENVSVSSSV